MNKSIPLHPTKGINPKLCFCPRCGGTSQTLVLVGDKDYVDECRDCGMRHFGGSNKPGKCQRKGCPCLKGMMRRKLEEMERLPGDLCESCQTELNEHKTIVASGGLFFKCKECGAEGVIKPNEFCAEIRKENNIPEGGLARVNFESCRMHSVEEDEHD